MNNRISILFWLCWCCVSVSIGQTGDTVFWKPFKAPPGRDLYMQATDSGLLYGRWYAESYRSADHGQTWQPFSLQFNNQPLSPSDVQIGRSGKFYYARPAGAGTPAVASFFRSDDEGQSWQLVRDSIELVKFFEINGDTLLGWRDSTVFRSVDGGISWDSTFSHHDLGCCLTIKSLNNGTLVAWEFLDRTAAWYSTDRGATWTWLPGPAAYPAAYFHVTPTGVVVWRTYDAANAHFRSTDYGQTWTPLLLPPTVGVQGMASLPSGRMLLDSDKTAPNKLYASDDNGVTWSSLGTLYEVAVNSQNTLLPDKPVLADGTVFGVLNESLYRSTDGGLTWQLSCNGVPAVNVERVAFISVDSSYAYTATGLWRTFDRGATWTHVAENKRRTSALFAKRFDIGPGGSVVAIVDNATLVSVDYGQTWTALPAGVSGNINISPDGSIWLLGNQYGMRRSTDGGLSWTTIGPTFVGLVHLAFHPTGKYYAIRSDVANAVNRLYSSDDQGAVWQEVTTLNTEPQRIAVAPNGYVYLIDKVGQAWGLKLSIDNGASWLSLPLPPAAVLNQYSLLAANAESHVLLSAGDRLYRSLDGGATWQILPVPPNWTTYALTTTNRNYFTAIGPDQRLLVSRPERGTWQTGTPTTEGQYLTGQVQQDGDNDCSTDDAQGPLSSWVVGANGVSSFFATTDSAGRYHMLLDTGVYSVYLQERHPIWWATCDDSTVVTLNQPLTTDTLDFRASALADCPLIAVNLGLNTLRRCFDNYVALQYCNLGAEPADSAYVDLELDPALSIAAAEWPYAALGNDVYRFAIGLVPPGTCAQFGVTIHVDCDSTVLGQTHCITAHGFPDTLCTAVPNWSGANLVAAATCQDSIVQFTLQNTGTAPTQALDYVIIEDDVVLFNGNRIYQPGEIFTVPQPANGSTWRIESEQEPGHPFSTLALAFSEGCGGFQSLGFINQFTVNGITPSWHTVCRENIGSYDPNDKQGFPAGFGPQNNIRAGQELDYLIRFQNTGTDTAFTVVIRDTLSPWLDPASVRVGAGSHPYTWALEGTGVLVFTFANILLPDSNVNEPASHGFISFSIDQQPDVPIGTEIFNTAAIYFDFNAPVITNQTRHTVAEEYLTGPTSHSASRPKQSSSVLIHPNPATDAAVVRPRDGAFAGERFTLTNAFGQVVHTATLRGKEYRIQRGGWPSGVYWWTVFGKRKEEKGKIMFK